MEGAWFDTTTRKLTSAPDDLLELLRRLQVDAG